MIDQSSHVGVKINADKGKSIPVLLQQLEGFIKSCRKKCCLLIELGQMDNQMNAEPLLRISQGYLSVTAMSSGSSIYWDDFEQPNLYSWISI